MKPTTARRRNCALSPRLSLIDRRSFISVASLNA
jgi:hypothetical protein